MMNKNYESKGIERVGDRERGWCILYDLLVVK